MVVEEYARPSSLEEAYEFIAKRGGLPMGGGAWMHLHSRGAQLVVDLSALGLDYIEDRGAAIAIGAMTSVRRIETSRELEGMFGPVFSRALRHIVGVQLRNLVTAGGTVAGKFGFSDLITLLVALGAEVVLYPNKTQVLSSFIGSAREMPVLVTELLVPKGARAVFQSVRIGNNDFAILNVCASWADEQGWRIAVGARPTVAMLAVGAAESLGADKHPSAANVREAAQRAARELYFGSDIRGSGEYRRHVCETLVERAILEVAQ